ncbi:hypothetical protein GUJ93_ZPchr0013g34019 [Zizania palustris]|uniref:Uncharacterized protein n=1 Tax=Zizania palustris TaxID=103762 RepID=A0A8J5WW45_ZIZPA|nr:hypothetical protein GUJ93_ZPchr0013g34019 [Zizania palustris]
MFFATEFADNVRLSGRNIGSIKMLTPRTLNLYDILDARKLFFTPSASDYLNSRYGATVFDEYEDDTDGEDDGDEEQRRCKRRRNRRGGCSRLMTYRLEE